MTLTTQIAPLADIAADWLIVAAWENEGVGNAGCSLHPQSRVRNVKWHTSAVTTGPPANAIDRGVLFLSSIEPGESHRGPAAI